MTPKEQLIEILNRIQSGEITPEEGLEKMRTQEITSDGADTEGIAENSEAGSPTMGRGDLPSDGNRQDEVSSAAPTIGGGQISAPAEELVVNRFPSRKFEMVETTPSSPSFEAVKDLENKELPQPTNNAGRNNEEETAEKLTGQPVGEVGAEREIYYWKQWWMAPFWIGTGVMVLGAMGMYYGYLAARLGLGFWLALIPFFLGVIVMAFSWQSKTARWLHLRVHQKPGEKPGTIAISFPLPIGLASWVLRNFSHLVPGLRDQQFNGNDLSDMLSNLGDSVSPENPFYVHVNGNDGEEVEVFIG